MDAWEFVASAGEAEREQVRTSSPLALGMFLLCGPVRVPIEVAAAEAGLEEQDSEPARVLRSFLENNPWEGMGSVTPQRWMLLARNDETMVFGQRNQGIGLGTSVTMSRRDVRGELGDRFQARNMGGCRPVRSDGKERAPGSGSPEPSFRARVEARSAHTVWASWNCGQDLFGTARRVLARVEVLETPDAVHFLVLSTTNPAYQLPAPGPSGLIEVVGTGRGVEASFELAAPLGNRALFSDYGVPADRVDVHRTDRP